MTEQILLLQADLDIQGAFERYEDCQEGRAQALRQTMPLAVSEGCRMTMLASIRTGENPP